MAGALFRNSFIVVLVSFSIMILSCFGFFGKSESMTGLFKAHQGLNRAKMAAVQAPVDRAAEIKSRVDREVANGVTLYTFSKCPYCLRAKTIFHDVGGIYNEVQIDKHEDGELIRAELKKRTGRTSVPSIWIAGQFIGGFSDGGLGGIQKLKENNVLQDMLAKAGALKHT